MLPSVTQDTPVMFMFHNGEENEPFVSSLAVVGFYHLP